MKKLLDEFDAKVGKRLKDYRTAHDIPQEKLAKYLGLPKQAISRMEKGKRRMNIEELEKIALFFDKPMKFFIQDEYKYINIENRIYSDELPVYMAKFLEDYSIGRCIDAGKNNLTDYFTNKFIREIKIIRSEKIDNLRKNNESIDLYKSIND
jgi:transcriptional regulator with XRE-family HTH domain